MRVLFPLLLILAGCAGNADGKWPSLAARPGELARDPGSGELACAGCNAGDVLPVAAVSVPLAPLPADVEARLAETTRTVGEIEAKAPAQGKRAAAAIAAALRSPALSGDAEVERSRFEALFLPSSIEVRRLEVLADDVAGRNGAGAVLVRIEALQRRIEALERLRASLPD